MVCSDSFTFLSNMRPCLQEALDPALKEGFTSLFVPAAFWTILYYSPCLHCNSLYAFAPSQGHQHFESWTPTYFSSYSQLQAHTGTQWALVFKNECKIKKGNESNSALGNQRKENALCERELVTDSYKWSNQ